MKLDIAKQWAAALKSGEFPQGRGALAEVVYDGTTEYCCLGVLCILAERAGVAERHPVLRGNRLVQFLDPQSTVGDSARTGVLPEHVRVWAGMKQADGSYVVPLPDDPDHEHYGVSLMGKNDSGVPFSEIADLIEQDAEHI